MDVIRGLLRILVLLAIAYACSSNRKAINWSLVIKALLIQAVAAVILLKIPFVTHLFAWIAKGFSL